MNTLTFHETGQTAEIPSGWDEMTPSQIQYVFRTFDECIREGASPLLFNIRVLYHLLGLGTPKKYLTLTYKEPKVAEQICENIYWLCHSCLDFLLTTEEEGGVPRLAYDSIRNSLPVVRSRFGPLLTGPADLLQDLTFGEFRHAAAALNTFFRSKEIADLDECIAYLYRPRSSKANRAGRKVQPLKESTFRKNVSMAAALPVWKKNLIMMWFSNCINHIQTRSAEIDGELVDFSQLFTSSGKPSKHPYNWNDLQVQIARDNVIGNIDRVDEEPLFKILSIMWTNYKENKNNESHK